MVFLFRKYEERQDKILEENRKKKFDDDENKILPVEKKIESCSCIEGNPCVDRYCCKNWEKRFEIAKKNGWKGFQ
jgi:hypothetical protein